MTAPSLVPIAGGRASDENLNAEHWNKGQRIPDWHWRSGCWLSAPGRLAHGGLGLHVGRVKNALGNNAVYAPVAVHHLGNGEVGPHGN